MRTYFMGAPRAWFLLLSAAVARARKGDRATDRDLSREDERGRECVREEWRGVLTFFAGGGAEETVHCGGCERRNAAEAASGGGGGD
jgi:hypothetical protein